MSGTSKLLPDKQTGNPYVLKASIDIKQPSPVPGGVVNDTARSTLLSAAVSLINQFNSNPVATTVLSVVDVVNIDVSGVQYHTIGPTPFSPEHSEASGQVTCNILVSGLP